MGSIYKRSEWHCGTCKKRLTKTAQREACKAAGHDVEKRTSDIYWIKYSRNGKGYDESSGSNRKADAKALLIDREGEIGRGKPVTPKLGKTTFDEAADDLLVDYRTNGKRSYGVVERRIRKHLTPHFGGWRLNNITTADVRIYVAKRQAEKESVRAAYTLRASGKEVAESRRPLNGASNAEINRELALLKRMFNLAIQGGKALHRPHIPMLKEDNVRTGFFEPEQLASVLAHLPAAIRPVIEFAALTGWRINSEVLPLEWRQVDFAAGEVRLDPGTTKNGDGRVFPFTAELRRLLEAQDAERKKLKEAGTIVPWVFFHMAPYGPIGLKKERLKNPRPTRPQPIVAFTKAWKTATKAAGCPGRIPHDLRRTAVRALVRAGIPERVCMMLTGHKTRSVFERYNIVSEGDLRDAARRLDARPGSRLFGN
jgi:integrase